MDFRLTDEQELVRSSVADFVEQEVIPAAAAVDEEGRFPLELFNKVAELGYLGIRYPEEYGGSGGDNVMFTILCEELARGSMCLAASVAMQCLMGTSFIHRFGSKEQKQRLLVPAIQGEKLGVIAMTESDAGSDLGAIRTTARRDGDGFVLNGRKMWVTNAKLADFFTVAAKTDPEVGFKGIDMFLVERERPGVSIGKDIAKMGVRGLGTGELIMEDCRIPEENLFGEEGTGFANLQGILEEIRIMMGSLSLGLGRAALDAAARYAQERIQFDRPIGKFQAISHTLADMATQLEAARLLVYRAAWLLDQGQCDMKLASMAKLFASEMANHLADGASRIFASYGFATEYDVQRYFRDARFLLLGGGTSEVLRGIIAHQMGLWG
ncbi:MAG: acyl-CoA dehydrogenase [Anaerolineae bacterium]|nr:acyl-CoA dehydrogenase [Anaerolineae bacterium]NIN96870.1 acyl-CoA dehydrogenase [Anaerolineae bacterium]NIQ79849.1 acyl-CoA dehydrogenase [Anaerolineae bacterium]